MPRTYNRKRKPRANRRYKRKQNKKKSLVPRILQPKVYKFKRDLEETVQLNGSAAPDGWSISGIRLYKNFAWALSSIGDSTDFSNLFRQYKINGARVRMYFSNTNSSSENSGTSLYFSNSQLLIRMSPNQRGTAEVLDDSYWTCRQAKKYKLALNGGRPLDIYMPLYVENEVASSTGTANTMKKPSYVSTDVANVVHHGLNLSIERVDGQSFSYLKSNYQYVKMITTLYFQMRGTE